MSSSLDPLFQAYKEVQFQQQRLAARFYIPRRELRFLSTGQFRDLALDAMDQTAIELHAQIFSRQPEGCSWTPPREPEYKVRHWFVPKSWFQRLKLRKGFNWLRYFKEVRMVKVEEDPLATSTVERLGGAQQPDVEIPLELYYPSAAYEVHRDMGYAVMYVKVPNDFSPGDLHVRHVEQSSRKRPLWLRVDVFEKFEQLREDTNMDADELVGELCFMHRSPMFR